MSVAFWIAPVVVICVLTLVTTVTYLHRRVSRPVFGGDLELVRVAEPTPTASTSHYASPGLDVRPGVARPTST